jgi:transcriptional antiterminator NusG
VSDTNLNDDAIEPDESVDDELDIVEGADEQDEFEAAEAEAGEPAEEAALQVVDEDETAADESAEEEIAEEESEPVDPVEALREELRSLPGEWYVIHTYAGY